MKRFLCLMYGVAAYLVFLGSNIYAIGFTGNLFVEKSIDSAQRVSVPVAIVINASLLLLFAVQRSIMARQSFKNRWARIVPAPIERSSYVLLASISLMALVWLWQPIGVEIWTVNSTAGKGLLLFFFFLGWSLVFISTFLINHMDLFGLRQVWRYYKGQQHECLPLRTTLFYRFARVPLHFGFLLALWCAPVMTASHLMFAIVCTGYIFSLIQFEDRDVVTVFGAMIIPFGKKKVS